MELFQHINNSFPSHHIISFSQINLDCTSRRPLISVVVPEKVMGQKNIILNLSPLDESRLVGAH